MNYQSDTIGQIVTEAREKKNWKTQRILAVKAKVDPVYICNVERDRLIPSIEIGAKIAYILELDLKNFLFLILRTKYPELGHIFK